MTEDKQPKVPFVSDKDRRLLALAFRTQVAKGEKETTTVTEDRPFCPEREKVCEGPVCGTWNRLAGYCARGAGTEAETCMLSALYKFLGITEEEEPQGEEVSKEDDNEVQG